MIQSEFVAWADGEAARIERGEAQRYHAVLCDPPYGLEFMGKEWDAPHKKWNRHLNDETRSNGRTARKFQIPTPIYEAGHGYEDWTRQWASALIPLLYPGALVFCFGGTRTWHRLACGFEDAGFQIWDTLMWLHGQGFPKAQDISKLIDKVNGDEREIVGMKLGQPGYALADKGRTNKVYGDLHDPQGECSITEAASKQSASWSGHKTAALKPAWEPVLCFKAPSEGKTYAELALEFGSGALNVDGARIRVLDEKIHVPQSDPAKRSGAVGTNLGISRADIEKFQASQRASVETANTSGHYPANLTLECTCEEVEVVDAPDTRIEKPCPNPEITGHKWGTLQGNRGPRGYAGKAIRHTDPKCPAAMLDAQAGDLHGAGNVRPSLCRVNSDRTYSGGWIPKVENPNFYNNKGGGPSRFFYCAKASRSEREAGLENSGLGVRDLGLGAERTFDNGRCESCGRVWIDGRRQGDCCESPKRTGIAGPQSEIDNRQSKILNDHPTVKPLALCRWLATLLLPPPLRIPSLRSQESDGLHRSPQIGPESRIPRRLLVPFAGTGSEMIGALEAGWDDVTGIEQDAHYREIAQARIGEFNNREPLFRGLEVGI